MGKLTSEIKDLAEKNKSILEGMLLLAEKIEEIEIRLNNPKIKTVFDPIPALNNLTTRMEKLEELLDEHGIIE